MRRMFSKLQLIALIIKTMGENIVNALLGKDINVEGITSKGIANTGGLANIGDVAISGDLVAQGEGKGNISATGSITGKTIFSTEAEYTQEFSVYGLPEGLSIASSSFKAFKVIHNVLYLIAALKVENNTENQISGGFLLYANNIPSEIGSKIFKVDGTNITVESTGSDREICDVPALYKRNVGNPETIYSRIASPAVNRMDASISNIVVDANSYSIVSIRVPIILL